MKAPQRWPQHSFLRGERTTQLLHLSGSVQHSQCLAQLSPACRDLLSRIFHIAEADRITVQEIMQHPWCGPLSPLCWPWQLRRKHAQLCCACIEQFLTANLHERAGHQQNMSGRHLTCRCITKGGHPSNCATTRYTAPLSQRLAEADARMLTQQSRIDARLSNCIVDEVWALCSIKRLPLPLALLFSVNGACLQ